MLLTLALALATAAVDARAADLPKATWAGDLTRAPVGPYLKVPPCEVTYDLGWNNWVTAGRATLSVREAGPYWRADATASSMGVARGLWKYDCEMSSIIERATTRPRFLKHSETDSEENCRYRVAFEPQRVITETTTTPVKGAPTSRTAVCPYGPMDDLLSVILYVRSQALTPGQKVTRVVQPWDKPYLTTFEVLGRETRTFDGKKRPCIKLTVRIRRIDPRSLEVSSYKKMKTSTIWISDDELRLPIEMHAEVFVGYMSARLTGLKWLTGKDAVASLPRYMTVKPPKE